MKTILPVLLVLLARVAFSADMKIARIEDKDHYTNIRAGQGTNFEILGTVDTNDLFYCEVSDSSGWYKALTYKRDKNNNQITGYMHKSRVRIIEQLPVAAQKNILVKVLSEEKRLGEIQNTAWEKGNWEDSAYRKAYRNAQFHSDCRYEPILEVLPVYFCKTKDKQILQLFFEVIWTNKGSASEIPAFAIGDCFVCEPGIIAQLILPVKNKEWKELIIEDIDWGLINRFSIGENEVPTDKKYIALKKRLDELK
ncbi:MAG TPA: SH3 domain-containing protein [Bacteroidia bacterium]|nr:SH3 domain-containing protein [Bacteroidia bacterium]